jgi:hypothetical protein
MELQEVRELEQKRIERVEEASAESERENRLYSIPQDTLPSITETEVDEVEIDLNLDYLLTINDEDPVELLRFEEFTEDLELIEYTYE